MRTSAWTLAICVVASGCSSAPMPQLTPPPCSATAAARQNLARCGPYGVEEGTHLLHDPSRRRDIPIKAYLPSGNDNARHPIVIFSHGLGNSHEGYRYLGRHWASHGFVSLHIGHRGTDVAAFLRRGPLYLFGAFFDRRQWRRRIDDLRYVVERVDRGAIPAVASVGDPARVVIAGHSLGALAALESAEKVIARVTAVVAMSPPVVGVFHRRSNDISIGKPTLFVYGSNEKLTYLDTATEDPRQADDVRLLIVPEADHDLLSDDERDPQPERERQISLIQAVTTSFLNAHLRGDTTSETWLTACLRDAARCLTGEP